MPIIAILIKIGPMTFLGELTWTTSISYGLRSNIFNWVVDSVVMLYVGANLDIALQSNAHENRIETLTNDYPCVSCTWPFLRERVKLSLPFKQIILPHPLKVFVIPEASPPRVLLSLNRMQKETTIVVRA